MFSSLALIFIAIFLCFIFNIYGVSYFPAFLEYTVIMPLAVVKTKAQAFSIQKQIPINRYYLKWNFGYWALSKFIWKKIQLLWAELNSKSVYLGLFSKYNLGQKRNTRLWYMIKLSPVKDWIPFMGLQKSLNMAWSYHIFIHSSSLFFVQKQLLQKKFN